MLTHMEEPACVHMVGASVCSMHSPLLHPPLHQGPHLLSPSDQLHGKPLGPAEPRLSPYLQTLLGGMLLLNGKILLHLGMLRNTEMDQTHM